MGTLKAIEIIEFGCQTKKYASSKSHMFFKTKNTLKIYKPIVFQTFYTL
jgi:hypothetical protein